MPKPQTQRTRINEEIRASELRVIGHEGENLGVISREEALSHAQQADLDLIEISPTANPPVAKIMDYGKFKYEQSKKEKQMKAHASSTETKVIQVKVGTSDHDLDLKAKRASNWLKGGHRVKIELFLRGRSKYMDKNFLSERIDRILKLISVDYKVATPPQNSPKGLFMIIERSK